MQQEQLDILNCIVCLELAVDAMECESCQAIYCCVCQIDLTDIKNQCAQCRQAPIRFRKSLIIRKLLETIPAECKLGCNQKISVGQLREHQKKCPMRSISCKFCDLKFQKSQLLEHVNTQHSDELLMMLDPDQKPQKNENNDSDLNIIGIQVNSNGDHAKLGKYGKYYCGKQLEHQCRPSGNSGCCNGYCGTTDGCNCSSCMKLDVKSRQLTKGYLVNREGRISKFNSAQQRFYCGSKVMNNNSFFSDGYCGPDDGNNCPACMRLDYQHDKRYQNVYN